MYSAWVGLADCEECGRRFVVKKEAMTNLTVAHSRINVGTDRQENDPGFAFTAPAGVINHAVVQETIGWLILAIRVAQTGNI
jgi:hypothetical protein